MEVEFIWDIFSINAQIWNFMKILPSERRNVPRRRADTRDEANSRLSQFSEHNILPTAFESRTILIKWAGRAQSV